MEADRQLIKRSKIVKQATVYFRKDKIFFHALSKTVDGVWVFSEPVFCVNKANGTELGASVLKALSGSKSKISHPAAWGSVFDPMLELAGVKSWAVFAKHAKCVEVEMDEGEVRFLPTVYSDGFEPLPELTKTSSLDESVLGEALLSLI